MNSNPYEVLGLNIDATEEEVKNARNELVKKYHPDRNPGYVEEANEKLKEINAAYEQIMNGWRPTERDQSEEATETVNEESCDSTEVANQVAAEAEEAPKAKSNKVALCITAIVVILALIVALVVTAAKDKQVEATEPSVTTDAVLDQTAEYTVPADTLADDVTHLGTYTVSDEDLLAAADTVVATLGDAKLTLAELQVYYWSEVFNFLNSYGSYASYLGLDTTVDLDKQACGMSETEMTWQQYFLGAALDSWCAYQALSLEADAAGHEMDQETKDFLAAIPEDMATLAASYGFTSTEELLLANFGPGVTVDTYAKHMYTYYNGYSYFSDLYEEVQYTDAEVEAYFEENADSYAEQEITKESGNYVNIRHVLLMPEDPNATTGEDGYPVYSEESWEECRVKVEAIYEEWKTGDMSEESFAHLAMDNSQDGNAEDGGLYENVYEGQMVPAFNDWCFDESRKTGDHGLVKTEYGYHIIFFVDSAEIWFTTAKSDMMNAALENIVPDAVAKYEMDVDFASIKLGYLNMAS